MQQLINELFDFTGREVNETAWQANLSINHGVALHSFFEAFKTHKQIGMAIDDAKKIAEFRLLIKGNGLEQSFTSQLSYEEILNGWNRARKASPKSLYDSIYEVYDRIGERIKRFDKSLFYSDELDWLGNFREVSPREIKELMESNILEYSSKYHEGILLPYQKEDSKLDTPRIFEEVLNEFPLDKLYKIIMATEADGHPPRKGPCPEYILETPEEELDIEEYYPSESGLMDVFWGMYLQKLAMKKGYPVIDNDYSLNHFVTMKNDALAARYL